jgi:hypothetical protein
MKKIQGYQCDDHDFNWMMMIVELVQIRKQKTKILGMILLKFFFKIKK